MAEVLNKLKEENDKEENSSSESKLTCVLSLGTGFTSPTEIDTVDMFMSGFNLTTLLKIPKAISGMKNLVDMFRDQITHADGEEVTHARSWCDSIDCEYFRISSNLKEDIPPDTTDINKMVNMLFHTEMHLLDCPEKIDQIAKKLLAK